MKKKAVKNLFKLSNKLFVRKTSSFSDDQDREELTIENTVENMVYHRLFHEYKNTNKEYERNEEEISYEQRISNEEDFNNLIEQNNSNYENNFLPRQNSIENVKLVGTDSSFH